MDDSAKDDAVRKESDTYVTLLPETIDTIRGMLDQAEQQIASARHLLFTHIVRDQAQALPSEPFVSAGTEGTRIIEGVFDGQQMLGRDGRTYPVPPNYASKSKLVTGDVLKLTISENGTFVYKQIGPVDRQKLIGRVEKAGDKYRVIAAGKTYQVLYASVTYFRAKPGDEITIIVPRNIMSQWAAIEHILEG